MSARCFSVRGIYSNMRFIGNVSTFEVSLRRCAPGRTQYYEWFTRFKNARQSIEDDCRPGRSSTSSDDTHVKKIKNLMFTNRHLTVRKLAEEVEISITKRDQSCDNAHAHSALSVRHSLLPILLLFFLIPEI